MLTRIAAASCAGEPLRFFAGIADRLSRDVAADGLDRLRDRHSSKRCASAAWTRRASASPHARSGGSAAQLCHGSIADASSGATATHRLARSARAHTAAAPAAIMICRHTTTCCFLIADGLQEPTHRVHPPVRAEASPAQVLPRRRLSRRGQRASAACCTPAGLRTAVLGRNSRTITRASTRRSCSTTFSRCRTRVPRSRRPATSSPRRRGSSRRRAIASRIWSAASSGGSGGCFGRSADAGRISLFPCPSPAP